MESGSNNPRGLGVRRFFAALALALACSSTAAEKKPVRVVTTILPLYCFASGVVGSNGEVQNLLPPNVGPHDYQLSPSDLRKLREADVIIMNGLGLDNWIKKAFDGSRNWRIIELGALLNKTNLIETATDLDMAGDHKHGHDHHHGPANPHIWLDPVLAVECVNIISNALAGMNPAFAKNAENYVVRLRELDKEIAGTLANVTNKPFVSQHDAFPYFIQRYGLKQVGVVELTPDVPPSPRYLGDLLKVIREKKVGVIFYEPPASPRLVKQIARDAKIRTAELNTLESGRFNPKAYEEGMRANAATLRRELEK
jgi:zinc/manganese transport system substrate-binding protein